MNNASNKAAIPNPAMKLFDAFIGEWETTGSHPLVVGDILHGRASFKWMEGGAFLVMHAEIFHEKFPDSIAIFGSDNTLEKFFMLYFDERGVSRKNDVVFQDTVLTWQRLAPGFSQRYTYRFTDNWNTIISHGELSKDDISWENDLSLRFTRIG